MGVGVRDGTRRLAANQRCWSHHTWPPWALERLLTARSSIIPPNHISSLDAKCDDARKQYIITGPQAASSRLSSSPYGNCHDHDTVLYCTVAVHPCTIDAGTFLDAAALA